MNTFKLPQKYSGLSVRHQALLIRWLSAYGNNVDLESITVLTEDRSNNFQAVKQIRGTFEGGKIFTGADLKLLDGRFRTFMDGLSGRELRSGFDETGIPERDGFRWVTIRPETRSAYGSAMQNCGCGRLSKEIVYSLYSPVRGHRVTCIVRDGIVMETKARKNQKPSKHYLPHFKDLILWSSSGIPLVFTSAPRWKPHLDLRFEDFSEADQEDILRSRPFFNDVVRYFDKEKFVLIGHEVFFHRMLSNEAFKTAAMECWSTTQSPGTLASIAINFERRSLTVPHEILAELKVNLAAAFVFLLETDPRNPSTDTRTELEELLSSDRRAIYSYAKYALQWENVSETVLEAL